MKYVFYNTILLLGTIITYWALPGVSNEICVSPTNEYLSCQPENSVLNQFLSARSIHSCGEETQQVCWNSSDTGQIECALCDTASPSSSYPISNLLSDTGSWISDGSAEAVIFLEADKSHFVSQITIKFLSALPTGTLIERSIGSDSNFFPFAYFAGDCSSAPVYLQSLCTEHSSRDTLVFSDSDGVKCTAIKVTFQSHPRSSTNTFYSHVLETVQISGMCDCNGHASECSGVGPNRSCVCRHNTAGRDCDTCQLNYYPSSEKSLSDPSYCGALCDCELCGIEDEFQPCDPVTNECVCKGAVEGDRCDRCKSGFHSLSISSATGCEPCYCTYGGAAAAPCDATTGQCLCRDGYTGSTCSVQFGFYTPSLEQIFSIRDITTSSLSAGTYVLTSGVTSGAGWRASSEDSFEVQFSVGESGDYTFIPVITASSPDVLVAVSLTSDSSDPLTYSIPASSLSQWNTVLFLNSEYVYTVSVGAIPAGALLAVEELLFLPLESGAISQDRAVLEILYAQCVPYNTNGTQECSLARELSASLTQNPKECDCSEKGSILGSCDPYGGQCYCTPNYGGRRCDQCAPGLQMGADGFCEPCNCDPVKSETSACNSTGYCYCTDKESTDESSKTCSSCNPGYSLSSSGACVPCSCDTAGSRDQNCDPISGDCVCKPGYEGARCDSCMSSHLSSDGECTLCPCPGTGNKSFAEQCSLTGGLVSCQCSDGFTGVKCEECAVGYFAEYSELGELAGCAECECSGNGAEVDGRLCDAATGVCLSCVGNTAGNSCEYCRDGFYQEQLLDTDVFSCLACECDVTGSEDTLCDRLTGTCVCREGFSGERCDQCAINNYNYSIGCPACSSCFNQVFELYSSLRGRLDWYQFLSRSGCTLLSSPLRDLLYSYSSNISSIRSDIAVVNAVDAVLYAELNNLSSAIVHLNNEVRELLQNAIDEETRSLVLRGRSEGSYQSVRDLLDKIEETLFRYTTDILSINNEFLLVYLGISRTIQDVYVLISRETGLVELQGVWSSEFASLSTEIVSTAVQTLSTARQAVQLQADTARVISDSFALLSLLMRQADLLNSTYPQIEEAADTAEEYSRTIESLLDFSPISTSQYSHDALSNTVLILEDFINQLRQESLSQTENSNTAINRSEVLTERGKFLQNVTNVLLNRLNSHRLLAQNAVEESNELIRQLQAKQREINSTRTESVLLVQLINQFLYLLNETQQASTISSSESTFSLVETAIREVADLAVALGTANNKAETAKVDARSATSTVNVMSDKVKSLQEDISTIESQLVEVEANTESLYQHETEGRGELDATESAIDSIVRYTEYFKSRVDLLEAEFLELNSSLGGIGVVSQEDVDAILLKISLLEAESDTNALRLEKTEESLVEEKEELEHLERAVYESYQQILEFDTLLDDLKEYNEIHGCN